MKIDIFVTTLDFSTSYVLGMPDAYDFQVILECDGLMSRYACVRPALQECIEHGLRVFATR